MSDFSQKHILSSFRDPSGFIFQANNEYYRQVNLSYKENYDLLISSGLFSELTKKKLLINSQEINQKLEQNAYKILKPDQISFVSYPYEWCFSQLKDAALLTLTVQIIALNYGMSLKDASAFNIQFYKGKPILIDTLSFEKYKEEKPWIAYRQFCQHFLAPLALMAKTDLRLGTASTNYIDGIPLDLAAKLLPFKSRFSLGLGTHIILHAKSQLDNSDKATKSTDLKLSKNQLIGILENLKSTITGLKLPKQKTTWDNYYNNTNYSDKSFKAKEKIMNAWIEKVKPNSIWDAGANDGYFARLGSRKKIQTIASDVDPIAVEHAYEKTKAEKDQFLLPLIIDLTNPSPSIGWKNKERESFLNRKTFDLTFCLAFIHHLAIANNLPLSYLAELFKKQTRNLIIEFVPKEDSNTQRLLANREDIFSKYNEEEFEKVFGRYFDIIEKNAITGSKRTLYLMEVKN